MTSGIGKYTLHLKTRKIYIQESRCYLYIPISNIGNLKIKKLFLLKNRNNKCPNAFNFLNIYLHTHTHIYIQSKCKVNKVRYILQNYNKLADDKNKVTCIIQKVFIYQLDRARKVYYTCINDMESIKNVHQLQIIMMYWPSLYSSNTLTHHLNTCIIDYIFICKFICHDKKCPLNLKKKLHLIFMPKTFLLHHQTPVRKSFIQ